MSKLKFYCSLILLVSIYASSQNAVTIEKLPHKNECRMCYGKLVVTNGMKTDTIFGGQWGSTPNYKILKIKSKEILLIDDDYGFPGGQSVKIFKLLSLDKNNFLDEIFKKEITLYKESHSNEKNVPINYIYRNNPIIKVKDSLEIISNIIIEKCPEIEGIECDTLIEINEIEYFKIGD